MMSHETITPGLAHAQQVYKQTDEVLYEAAAVARPDAPDMLPVEALPKPPTVRKDLDPQSLGYTPDQEAALRALAAKLGLGKAVSTTPSDLGFGDYYPVYAGGRIVFKPHAQMEMVNQDTASVLAAAGKQAKSADRKTAANVTTPGPKAHFLLGSTQRKVGSGEDEVAAAERYGLNPGEHTERDGHEAVAREMMDGFVPVEPPVVLPFGYTPDKRADNTHETFNDSSAELFRLIGHAAGAPVISVGVERRDYSDANSGPDVGGMLGIIDKALTNEIFMRALGSVPDATTPITLVESNTYAASRIADAARVSLQTGRPVGTATYGTELAAEIQGIEPKWPSMIQVAGELHVAAAQNPKLGEAIDAAVGNTTWRTNDTTSAA